MIKVSPKLAITINSESFLLYMGCATESSWKYSQNDLMSVPLENVKSVLHSLYDIFCLSIYSSIDSINLWRIFHQRRFLRTKCAMHWFMLSILNLKNVRKSVVCWCTQFQYIFTFLKFAKYVIHYVYTYLYRCYILLIIKDNIPFLLW